MLSKPISFALVPGSFSPPQMYDKCETLLNEQGYESHPVSLLSASDESRLPPAIINDDIYHIHSSLLSILEGPGPSNIILAVHSYAGLPSTATVQGLNKASCSKVGKSTAVLGILYIAAHIPEVGESIRSVMIHNSSDLFPEPYRTGWPGEYMPAIPRDMGHWTFSDLEDHAEANRYRRLMEGMRHSNDAFSGECTFAGWVYEDMKCVLILPEQDRNLPVAVQEWMVKRRSGNIRVRRVAGAGNVMHIDRS
jgi:hypothetical protein